MPACKKYGKCINQLFESSLQIPTWMRQKGMGDCTTCQPCSKNAECIGYYPAPALIKMEIRGDDSAADGSLDDNGRAHDSHSGDTSDTEAS